MRDKLYEEVGLNYRFFLNWRHATFAGHLLVLWAIASLCISAYKDAQPFLWIIPLAGAPFGLLFWVIDVRIQVVFQNAIEAGRAIEGEAGGYFTSQRRIGTVPGRDKYPRLFTHTIALRTAYLSSFLLLTALGIYFRYQLG